MRHSNNIPTGKIHTHTHTHNKHTECERTWSQISKYHIFTRKFHKQTHFHGKLHVISSPPPLSPPPLLLKHRKNTQKQTTITSINDAYSSHKLTPRGCFTFYGIRAYDKARMGYICMQTAHDCSKNHTMYLHARWKGMGPMDSNLKIKRNRQVIISVKCL